MPMDRQGNPMSGATTRSAEAFDRAVVAFNLYRGDPLSEADAALADAPEHAMAALLKAHLLALATEPAAAAEARRIVAGLHARAMGEREASHLAVLDELLRGNWVRAAL
jgi:hypothetical protein